MPSLLLTTAGGLTVGGGAFLGGAAAAGGSMFGAHRQASSATQAAQIQAAATNRAIRQQQMQDDIARVEAARVTARQEAQEDIDRQREEQDRQRTIALNKYYVDLQRHQQASYAPYRAAAAASRSKLAGLLGVPTRGAYDVGPPPVPPSGPGLASLALEQGRAAPIRSTAQPQILGTTSQAPQQFSTAEARRILQSGMAGTPALSPTPVR